MSILRKLMFLSLMAVTFIFFTTGCEAPVHKGYKQTVSGIYYKIHTTDNPDTVKIRVGDIITVDMVYYINDSTLFDSKDSPTPVRLQVVESESEGDIYEAMRLLARGDSATLILDGMNFFTKTMRQPVVPDFVKEGDEIVFDITVNQVQTEDQANAENAAQLEELKSKESGLIQEYIENNDISVEPNESGIYFIDQVSGTGKSPETDDWAVVHYIVHTLGGEKLFASREQSEDPLKFQLGNRFENEGFQEVVLMMKKGGRAAALVPSERAFGAQGAGQIVPPYTPLFYEVELLDIMNQEEYDAMIAKEAELMAQEAAKKKLDEKTLILDYLAANTITPTLEHEDGILYVEQEKGTGPQPQIGQTVKVHYTGMLLDGSVFDSSVERGAPFEFVLGQGRVIQGWDKGIPFINVGGKGTLIIPFDQGYGERGSGARIPPYSTLVFDIEVLEVTDPVQ